MMLRSKPAIPATRVISPSPTPSEAAGHDGSHDYFGPVTRSAARRRQTGSATPIHESLDEDSDPELRRARTRSRSPMTPRQPTGLTKKKTTTATATTPRTTRASRRAELQQPEVVPEELTETANGVSTTADGSLAPPGRSFSWDWRDFSRSPSPLGLIPIHRHFKTFIHKHEVPRKALHVSIGFFVYWLYVSGTQPSSVAPWLLGFFIPIASTDFLRHTYPSLNAFYVKCLGAFMRESEYAGWNGVVWYLLGAWTVLYFLPKDVAIVSIMLLSWCDTAASTFGRAWGRYTPRIRRGKSLAGTLAAFLVGVVAAGWFWGWVVPRTPSIVENPQNPFMFKGVLRLPDIVATALGLGKSQATITGNVALGVMSLWSGVVAAGSEVVDIFGWDDNLTIPVLSGVGIWAFLKVFA